MRLLWISLFIFLGLSSYAQASWQMSAGSVLSYERYNSEEVRENRQTALQFGREFDEWLGRFEYSASQNKTEEGVLSVMEESQNFIYWSDYRVPKIARIFEPYFGFGIGIKKSKVQQKFNRESIVSEGYDNLLGVNLGINVYMSQSIFGLAETRVYKETRGQSQPAFYLALGFRI